MKSYHLTVFFFFQISPILPFINW